MKQAFTLVELIFVIVIIGVLSAVAIPQFTKLTDNAKISAELSTASAIQTAIESCHGEWIISDCPNITCGVDINMSNPADFTAQGYPTNAGMGVSIERILKSAGSGWTRSGADFTGPASDITKGTTHCKTDKPCIGKKWTYDETTGEFALN